MKRLLFAAIVAISSVAQAGGNLMLFGGKDQDVYLGCVNCSEYSSDSIFNKFGNHGSAFSTESIYNKFSDYGSAYSDYGVCNKYANNPPVIVDESGGFYGAMTMNKYHKSYSKNDAVDRFLATLCRN